MKQIEIMSPVAIGALLREAPEGVVVTSSGRNMVAMSAAGMVWEGAFISWAGKVSAAVVARFLYDVIQKHSKNQPAALRIDDKQVGLTEEKIVEFIEKNVEE